nr:uncharacterized protein LOC128685377 [Cherax quadricarinatus]
MRKNMQDRAVGYADQTKEYNLDVLLSEDETEGINEADNWYHRGNYRKALDRYEELVNGCRCMEKELPHVFLMMANAYFVSGFQNAQIYYDRAIEEAKCLKLKCPSSKMFEAGIGIFSK